MGKPQVRAPRGGGQATIIIAGSSGARRRRWQQGQRLFVTRAAVQGCAACTVLLLRLGLGRIACCGRACWWREGTRACVRLRAACTPLQYGAGVHSMGAPAPYSGRNAGICSLQAFRDKAACSHPIHCIPANAWGTTHAAPGFRLAGAALPPLARHTAHACARTTYARSPHMQSSRTRRCLRPSVPSRLIAGGGAWAVLGWAHPHHVRVVKQRGRTHSTHAYVPRLRTPPAPLLPAR